VADLEDEDAVAFEAVADEVRRYDRQLPASAIGLSEDT